MDADEVVAQRLVALDVDDDRLVGDGLPQLRLVLALEAEVVYLDC